MELTPEQMKRLEELSRHESAREYDVAVRELHVLWSNVASEHRATFLSAPTTIVYHADDLRLASKRLVDDVFDAIGLAQRGILKNPAEHLRQFEERRRDLRKRISEWEEPKRWERTSPPTEVERLVEEIHALDTACFKLVSKDPPDLRPRVLIFRADCARALTEASRHNGNAAACLRQHRDELKARYHRLYEEHRTYQPPVASKIVWYPPSAVDGDGHQTLSPELRGPPS